MLRLAVGKPTWLEKTVYNVSMHKSDKTSILRHENELLKKRETTLNGLTLSWKREFACLLVVLEPGWLKISANTKQSLATTCIAIELILQNLHDSMYRFGPWEHIIFWHANIDFALLTFWPTFLVWSVLLVGGRVCKSMFGGDPVKAGIFMKIWPQSSDGHHKQFCLLQITRYHFDTWRASEYWQLTSINHTFGCTTCWVKFRDINTINEFATTWTWPQPIGTQYNGKTQNFMFHIQTAWQILAKLAPDFYWGWRAWHLRGGLDTLTRPEWL